MARIKCFLVEPSEHVERSLRVDMAHWGEHGEKCPASTYGGGHGARVPYDVVTAPYAPDANGVDRSDDGHDADLKTQEGVSWPDHCDACSAPFPPYPGNNDGVVFRYVDRARRWRNTETGEEIARLHESMPGAMWRAPWLRDYCASQDMDAPLCVMTPGGEWVIDSQASNCTMPDDRHQDRHHCWVRRGVPPEVNVDKAGVTCGAGAGSIQCHTYHGFLRNGWLED